MPTQPEALELVEKAIEHAINPALYYRNICEIYRTLGRLDEAEASAQRATTLAPNDPLCLHNLAIIQYERLEIDASIDSVQRGLLINPELPVLHFELAEAFLLKGEWERGWQEYEWRFQIPSAAPLMPKTDKSQWDGTPFTDATLLLIGDQGFGDVIQFARYIPWVAERCPNLAIACSPETEAVLQQIHPSIKTFLKWDDCPPYRSFCPLSGLPRLHGTRVDNIPAPIPYLRSDPDRLVTWRTKLDRLAPKGFKRVGIVWAGRPTHNNDRRRFTTLSAFAPLFNLPRTTFISLQKNPKSEQSARYFGRAPLINLDPEIKDYNDTMAILDCLDTIVTVDTSVAHLAAAMGRPIHVMLARVPDWRWLLDRSDTPWYPTMHLHRQTVAGQWDDVAMGIANHLRAQFDPPPAPNPVPPNPVPIETPAPKRRRRIKAEV